VKPTVMESSQNISSHYVVASLLLIAVAILARVSGPQVLAAIAGVVVPTYQSFLALEGDEEDSAAKRKLWILYWSIFAFLHSFFSMLEVFFCNSWLFWTIRIASIVLLWFPKRQVSEFIYNKILAPFWPHIRLSMERYVNSAASQAHRASGVVIHEGSKQFPVIFSAAASLASSGLTELKSIVENLKRKAE